MSETATPRVRDRTKVRTAPRSGGPAPAARSPKAAATIIAPKSVPNFSTARYLYKIGVVVADDVIQGAASKGALPLDGALVVRLKKPIPCVFVSFGLNGVVMPDSPLCLVGDSWNSDTKEEKFALCALMNALDSTRRLNLRMQWFLIDMKDADARVIKSPTNEEISRLFRTPSAMKGEDATMYKLITRVARRRTTAGADLPDGHEGDSDMDPMEVYLSDMIEKEEKADKARKKRLGPFPDTEVGARVCRLVHGEISHKSVTLEDKVDETRLARYKAKKYRSRTMMYQRSSEPKKKRTFYGEDPNGAPIVVVPTASPHAGTAPGAIPRYVAIDDGRCRDPAPAQMPALASGSRSDVMTDLFGDSSGCESGAEGDRSAVVGNSFGCEAAKTALPPPLQQTDPKAQPAEHSDCESEDPLAEEEDAMQHSCSDDDDDDDDDDDGDGIKDDYWNEEPKNLDYGEDGD
jgi:hypothetical protein